MRSQPKWRSSLSILGTQPKPRTFPSASTPFTYLVFPPSKGSRLSVEGMKSDSLARCADDSEVQERTNNREALMWSPYCVCRVGRVAASTRQWPERCLALLAKQVQLRREVLFRQNCRGGPRLAVCKLVANAYTVYSPFSGDGRFPNLRSPVEYRPL